MNDLTIYLLSILVAIGLIKLGSKTRMKSYFYLGVGILLIDFIVPVSGFVVGLINGIRGV